MKPFSAKSVGTFHTVDDSSQDQSKKLHVVDDFFSSSATIIHDVIDPLLTVTLFCALRGGWFHTNNVSLHTKEKIRAAQLEEFHDDNDFGRTGRLYFL